MLLHVLFSAAFLAVVSGNSLVSCPQAADRNCDDRVLNCCDSAFQRFTNISQTCGHLATMTNPKCVRKALGNIYGNDGTAGVLKVCDGYNQYRTCLGKSVISCTTERYYIQNALVDVRTAQILQALYTELNFICGAGMDLFLNNDKCLAQTLKNNATDIELCREQFRRNVEANPADACSFEQELLTCVERPFLTNCNKECGWWACELERVIAGSWLPGCSTQCSFSQSVHIMSNLKKEKPSMKH